MGEVRVAIELENFIDRVNAEQGILAMDQVRSFKTQALVDTGRIQLRLFIPR